MPWYQRSGLEILLEFLNDASVSTGMAKDMMLKMPNQTESGDLSESHEQARSDNEFKLYNQNSTM